MPDILPNIGEATATFAARLREAGIEQPLREARLLMSLVLNIPVETMIAWPETAVEDMDAVKAAIARRISGEPYSRIAGHRGFWRDQFILSSDTLDPRPDTEALIEAILKHYSMTGHGPGRILDLGTGTGCILLSLLREFPEATGIGTDVASGARDCAARNADLLGLAQRSSFVRSDWFDNVSDQFDLIVSNPPYIDSGEIAGLAPEVRNHDPRLALDGGADGLDAYRQIIGASMAHLTPNGVLALEIGFDQRERVAGLCERAGYQDIKSGRDLSGHDRYILATRSGF